MPDYRNRGRQSHCGRSACQRVRRAQGQRIRRQKVDENEGRGTVEDGMKPPEAACVDAWMAQNPVFVGLISMLTNTHLKSEVRDVIRNLQRRGEEILKSVDS